MDLTVVITTYNRSKGLKTLLDAFAAEGSDFQVVVAIDGSTDDTEAMLQQQKQPYELTWRNTYCKGYGLAVARNQGILAADGQAVVILDDDSFPQPGFVAAHRRSVTSGVITGGPRNPSDPAAAPRMAWKMAELAKVPPLTPKTVSQMRRDYPNAYLIENNICLFKEDWIKLGLFSERLKLYGFIGQEFFARAAYRGVMYQYNPNAAVIHRGEMEGDNGLQRSRKTRQTKFATLIRPSLETPRHFDAQIAWAKAMHDGTPSPPMPSFKWQVAAGLPGQAFGMAGRAIKRRIRFLLGRVSHAKE